MNNDVAHIFIMDNTGSNVRQLTTGYTWNGAPEFGVDGYIYFSSNAGNSDPYRRFDNYDIWRLKPNFEN
jgi:Tol biopolymer transport system component